jgi:hypothetical protein
VTQARRSLAALAFLIAACFAWAQPAAPASSADKSLNKFLRNYVRNDGRVDDDKTAEYLAALVDLNGDGKKEAIVYLMGRTWCGSGGCPTLVLVRTGTSWKILQYITLTWPPIRVLSQTSHGWHDISVWVQGGGTHPGYEAELSFDGKAFSGNPSVPPARHLTGKVPGEIVIRSMEGGTPLYP